MMKLVMVAGTFALIGCGSGKPWDGASGGPEPVPGGPSVGGGSVVRDSGASGGEESESGGGRGHAMGGISAGGSGGRGHAIGGEGGASEVVQTGGISSGGPETSEGGESSGGSDPVGGSSPVGGGDRDLDCLVNVSHCFEAAANCFAYSPGSDCDQIVDVCAAIQADCDALGHEHRG